MSSSEIKKKIKLKFDKYLRMEYYFLLWLKSTIESITLNFYKKFLGTDFLLKIILYKKIASEYIWL